MDVFPYMILVPIMILLGFAAWVLWSMGKDSFTTRDEMVVESPLAKKLLMCKLGWHRWFIVHKGAGREYSQCTNCGSRKARGGASLFDSPLNYKWLKGAEDYSSLNQVKDEDYGALETALRVESPDLLKSSQRALDAELKAKELEFQVKTLEKALYVRPEVASFARIMEEVLRKNDHKGGWRHCDPKWLLQRLFEEAEELRLAVDAGAREVVTREAADVANFAMMIVDVTRGRDEDDERDSLDAGR